MNSNKSLFDDDVLLQSETATTTTTRVVSGSSAAVRASNALAANQLLRTLVAHLMEISSSTESSSSCKNRLCEIQDNLSRLLKVTALDSRDRLSLENLLRGTPLIIDLLTAACRQDSYHATVESIVLNNPLLIDQQDSMGVTPLTAASATGNLDVVRWLHNNKANVNTPTSHGQTPLILACQRRQHELFRWFMCGDASIADVAIDIVDNEGNTALHYIIETNCHDGRTPLHNVCIEGEANNVRKLVFASSRNQVNAQDNDGWTPLHLACLIGKHDAVNILMWAGADIDAIDNNGCIPGEFAAILGYYDIAVLLGYRPYADSSWFPTDFPFFFNAYN